MFRLDQPIARLKIEPPTTMKLRFTFGFPSRQKRRQPVQAWNRSHQVWANGQARNPHGIPHLSERARGPHGLPKQAKGLPKRRSLQWWILGFHVNLGRKMALEGLRLAQRTDQASILFDCPDLYSKGWFPKNPWG